MIRSTVSKAMWVGRTTAAVVGLAIALALVFGVATMALAAVPGDPFKLGQINTINALTQLVGNRNGPMLLVDNNSTGDGASTLNLQVDRGNPPIKVNASSGTATNLSADKLDGKDQRAFADVSELDADQVVIHSPGPLPVQGTYTSDGDTLVIMASGSGYRGGGSDVSSGKIGMLVKVNGFTAGKANGFAEAENISEVFVGTNTVVTGLPAGTHTIRLEDDYDEDCDTSEETIFTYCTRTNTHDNFAVTIVELSD
jgi:hypothetical protein